MPNRRPLLAVLMVLIVLVSTTTAMAAPRLSSIPIPGETAFVRVARNVMDIQFSIDPSMASGSGLFDDAVRVPDYDPAHVDALIKRLDGLLGQMRLMPWRNWNVDRQIDFRWVYANAETARRELAVERIWLRRPGAWLEPTANNLIALVTYAPRRLDLQAAVLRLVPAMCDQMERLCKGPTRRDVNVARGIIKGLLAMCAAAPSTEPGAAELADARKQAAQRLQTSDAFLAHLHGLPEFKVVGREDYAWRLRRAELLPWTPTQLLALAESERRRVAAEMKRLKPHVEAPPPATPQQKELARTLTRDKLLALYDAIPIADRKAVVRAGMVTIPAQVGPIHARETPDAMVPLTGDGGSMNPPPPYGDSNVGYWNVEHFHANWPFKRRLQAVVHALNFRNNDLGPYAAHEGIPGHHLQLSIARLIPNPIRSVMSDSVENEGWAVYCEEAFWRDGGLGHSVAAEYNTLDSYMFRIHRVMYDVNIESGRWNLQQGADYEDSAAPGKGKVDEDTLRAINWPTQLIAYFSGKMQILALRADYRRKLGHAYTERRFHDALLSLGSIPFVFARCKLLGERVPDI